MRLIVCVPIRLYQIAERFDRVRAKMRIEGLTRESIVLDVCEYVWSIADASRRIVELSMFM